MERESAPQGEMPRQCEPLPFTVYQFMKEWMVWSVHVDTTFTIQSLPQCLTSKCHSWLTLGIAVPTLEVYGANIYPTITCKVGTMKMDIHEWILTPSPHQMLALVVVSCSEHLQYAGLYAEASPQPPSGLFRWFWPFYTVTWLNFLSVAPSDLGFLPQLRPHLQWPLLTSHSIKL